MRSRMSAYQGVPPPFPSAPELAPGVQAARKRAKLSQVEVARRMNVPIDTFRGWDQDRHRPSSPERMQQLAAVLGSPIDVIWPPRRDPHVAAALGPEEIQAPQDVPDIDMVQASLEPVVQAADIAAATGAVAPERAGRHAGDRPAGSRRGRRRVTVAVVVAALGVGGAVALSSGGGEDVPSAPSAAASVRARMATQMRSAVQNGDYDMAIKLAGQLGDATAASGYRDAGAKVLVARAEKAASRGELPLASSRLRRAQDRYGTAPGAEAVRSRIARIEKQRADRASQRRAAARRQAERQSAAAASGSANTAQSSSPDPQATSTTTQTQAATTVPNTSSTSSTGSEKKSDIAKGDTGVDPGLMPP